MERRAAPARHGRRAGARRRDARARGCGPDGNIVTFSVGRGGVGSSPDLVLRLLARLDAEELDGRLALAGPTESAAQPGTSSRRAPLGSSGEALEALPPDWSDVYAEVELDSSDYLERGALLLAPVNPARVQERLAFRFRAARRFGYGASGGMTQRCFERLDGEGITGQVPRPAGALRHEAGLHEGPVWYVGGQAV